MINIIERVPSSRVCRPSIPSVPELILGRNVNFYDLNPFQSRFIVKFKVYNLKYH